jgi:hypothetical protein
MQSLNKQIQCCKIIDLHSYQENISILNKLTVVVKSCTMGDDKPPVAVNVEIIHNQFRQFLNRRLGLLSGGFALLGDEVIFFEQVEGDLL